ncbi:MAG: membrane protein, partial [Acidobacteria bacterium]
IAFQLALIVSGNLSWLNWLTIVLAIPTLHNRWLSWLPASLPPQRDAHFVHRAAIYVLAAVVGILSVAPMLNMLSSNQLMNSSFEPLHLVNTYGAFGSITRTRDEIVIEGTADPVITEGTVWREYEFKGKPGDLSRMPPQVAPYHLRLDWLMWFAAMSAPSEHPWFEALLEKLLDADPAVLSLLRVNPFPDRPPRYVRARLYRYSFTTPEERARTGQWWRRDAEGLYFPAVGR